MISRFYKDNIAILLTIIKTQKEFHAYLSQQQTKVFYRLIGNIVILALSNTVLIWYLGKPFEFLVSGDYDGLISVILILVGVVLINQILHYIDSFYTACLGLDYIADLRKRLLNHFVYSQSIVTDEVAKGNLLTRFTHDVYTMRRFIVNLRLSFCFQVFIISLYSGMLIFIDWQLAFLTALLAPFFFLHQKVFSKKKREAAKRYYDKNGKLLGKEEEVISNLRVIKAFNCQNILRKNHDHALNKMMFWAKKEIQLDELFLSSLTIIVYFCALFIVYQGISKVEAGTLEIAELISFLLFAGYLSTPVRAITRLFFQAQANIMIVDRLRPYMSESNVPNKQSSDTQSSDEIIVDSGQIVFENVSWSSENVKIIQNLSFEISAGSTIAIVGSSGVGKSTIANLLMGFIRPDSGSILIDKQNIKHFSVEALRDKVGIVWQSPMLFDDTIKNNMLLAYPNATDDKIQAALHDSDAASFVDELSEGVNSIIGADGVILSAGQKQRLHIAQAFLRNSAILIMDEATSALDSESEQKLVHNIKRTRKGRTTILIAHRYSSLRFADYIIYLNNDGTVATGTHEELLEKHIGYEQALNWQSGF